MNLYRRWNNSPKIQIFVAKMAIMKYSYLAITLFLFLSCGAPKEKPLTAQEIVDKAIEVAGGGLYRSNRIDFKFRGVSYRSCLENGKKVLIRIIETDTATIVDKRAGNAFTRMVNGLVQQLPDSTENKFSNSVNSVHYFAYLPYGLNSPAVHKELLGKTTIREKEYYKIQVTFSESGGGEDFEDVFVYWFNTETFRPDYLAYMYHTNGGGVRFREAVNDRQIGGIYFADYRNYRPLDSVSVTLMDSLFLIDRLEEFSRIELEEIQVSPDNCNLSEAGTKTTENL
jgi:hypothetical protein